MKMYAKLMSGLVVLTLLGLGAMSANGALLFDDFNDNSLDGAKWSVGGGAVAETNQHIEFSGGWAVLNTVSAFDPATIPGGLTVIAEGGFAVAANPPSDNAILDVTTRSNGSGAPIPAGIRMSIYLAGPTPIIDISGFGGASVASVVTDYSSLALAIGDTFVITATDDGTNITLDVREVGDASSFATGSATSSYVSGSNLVSFAGAGNGRTEVTTVDNVTIIPEPGTIAMLGCGLLMLLACGWRRSK